MSTTEVESLEPKTLDFSLRYSVDSYPGVAFRILRYAEYPDHSVDWICDDSGHWHDESCYVEEFFTSIDYNAVIAVMVGDDYKHLIDVTELSPIEDEDYCSSCGQIGCGWH